MGSIFDEAGKMREREKKRKESQDRKKEKAQDLEKLDFEPISKEDLTQAAREDDERFEQLFKEYQEQLKVFDSFYDKLPFEHSEIAYYKENPERLPEVIRQEIKDFKEEVDDKVNYVLNRDASDQDKRKAKNIASKRKSRFLGDQRGWMKIE